MKADRRHELKENDFAVALESARDYIDRNGKQISLVLLLVIVVFAAVSFGIRSHAASVAQLWRDRSELKFDPPDVGKKSLNTLEHLISQAPDDTFAMACLLDAGREALRLAASEPMPSNKELNDKARQTFTMMRERFPRNTMALGTAITGLATVEENAFSIDGDASHKERSRDLLKQVAEGADFAGLPPLQRIARDRLASLDETFTRVAVQPAPPPPPPEAAPPTEGATPPSGDH
ncbi:MAG: hypothetical protein HY287_11145 [Planctomycetes bacterium]|nr:hypothetical protein [Planctomycetota bacterium]MBI3834874.1 hypothetical protein [Planctomycetota bacterium]